MAPVAVTAVAVSSFDFDEAAAPTRLFAIAEQAAHSRHGLGDGFAQLMLGIVLFRSRAKAESPSKK